MHRPSEDSSLGLVTAEVFTGHKSCGARHRRIGDGVNTNGNSGGARNCAQAGQRDASGNGRSRDQRKPVSTSAGGAGSALRDYGAGISTGARANAKVPSGQRWQILVERGRRADLRRGKAGNCFSGDCENSQSHCGIDYCAAGADGNNLRQPADAQDRLNMLLRRCSVLALACLAITIAGEALHGQQPAAQSMVALRRSHIFAREQWQMNGRPIPAANAAALRIRAIQQKLQLRFRPPVSQTAPGASGVWLSLAPSPLPSDPSGTGLQDYGWVTGRATAVAIDPNDLSGNTVFAGGAYGGVWKSSNGGAASPNPVSVNWTALTDDQATLAIGAIAIQPQLLIPDPTKSVVLAGTGGTNTPAECYYGFGILRSPDGGASWSPIISQDSTGTHSFAGLGFSQIAFSSGNPNVVVAAAASASQRILEGLENPKGSNRGL